MESAAKNLHIIGSFFINLGGRTLGPLYADDGDGESENPRRVLLKRNSDSHGPKVFTFSDSWIPLAQIRLITQLLAAERLEKSVACPRFSVIY
jgi:hypothetical protein